MKPIIWKSLFLFGMVVLSSCAKAPESSILVEKELAVAIQDCYKAKAQEEAAVVSKLQTSQDAIVYYAMQQLGKAANKQEDYCASITTNADLQKIAMEENTKRTSAWLGFGGGAVKSLMTTILGVKALDTLGDIAGDGGTTINGGGDVTVSGSQNINSAGDDLGSMSSTIPQTTTTNTDSYNPTGSYNQ